MHERDFEGFEPSSDDPTHVVQSIVDFGMSMGLEASSENYEKLVDEQNTIRISPLKSGKTFTLM